MARPQADAVRTPRPPDPRWGAAEAGPAAVTPAPTAPAPAPTVPPSAPTPTDSRPVAVAGPDKPPPPPETEEDHAKKEIAQLVKNYCAELETMDPARVQKIFPLADVRTLREQSRQYKSLQCTLTGRPEYQTFDVKGAGGAQLKVRNEANHRRTIRRRPADPGDHCDHPRVAHRQPHRVDDRSRQARAQTEIGTERHRHDGAGQTTHRPTWTSRARPTARRSD